MSATREMMFRLRDMPQTREFALADDFMRDALSAIPGQSSLTLSPGHINVGVEVTEEQQQTVLARGRLEGRVKVACSRCLGPVELAVSDEFSLTFLPKPDPGDAEADDGIELDEDDLDVGVHDGSKVDISDVLRDHIVLSVPYAPLCSEQCKGLCAQCGTDLNKAQCECAPAAADSRWGALENLKLK